MRESEGHEFFVGYAPPMPPRLARFVKRTVLAISGLSLLVAATFAAGHVPIEGGTFEFGHPRAFSGTLIDTPYPAVRLHAGRGQDPTPLLVAPGKHGADAAVKGLAGAHVRFNGTRIARGGATMIELDPGSVSVDRVPDTAASSLSPAALVSAAGLTVELTGEVVDSKCFLGVMVPGAGKTHGDCASLCLRGGIPPALLVQDQAGHSALLLLASRVGGALSGPVVASAGRSVTMRGTLYRQNGWLVLWTDPSTWQPVH